VPALGSDSSVVLPAGNLDPERAPNTSTPEQLDALTVLREEAAWVAELQGHTTVLTHVLRQDDTKLRHDETKPKGG